MAYELNKTIADELSKAPGEVRGAVFKTDEVFITSKGGPDATYRIEKLLADLGHPIKYKEASNLAFFPLGLRVLSLLAASQVLGLDEAGVKEMGTYAPRVSFILRFFLQYFSSIRKTFGQIAEIWRRHYTVGDLTPAELDEEKKYLLLRLENFSIHPIMCHYLAGYFAKFCEMVVNSPTTIEEQKCVFRGGQSHDFLVKW